MKHHHRKFSSLCVGLVFISLATNAADSLYWGNESSSTIQFGNLDGSGSANSLFTGEGGPCGLTIDSAANKIYWANFGSNTVRVANLDGTGTASTLFAESGSLCGVAIDPPNNKIYWANFGTNEIRVGNLDGTGAAATLFSESFGSGPSGVTIDVVAGLIYWTNQFSDEVRVGNIDGSGTASTLYGSEDNPIGIAIDVDTQLLYWTDLNSGLVQVGASDGSSVSTLFSGETQPGGLSIDSDAGKIYWATFGPGNIRAGNLDGSGTASTLFSGQSNPLFTAILKTPANLSAPIVTGSPNIGETLSCSTGDWAADDEGAFLFQAPNSFEYSWQKNGVTIGGATSSTLVPIRTGRYTCTVKAHNQAGDSEETTSISVNVKCMLGSPNCD